MTTDKDTFIGDVVVIRVRSRPLRVQAELRATAPRLIASLGTSPFWSGWMGRLLAAETWDTTSQKVWLNVGPQGDVGVAFIADVVGPTSAPVSEAAADMLHLQTRLLDLGPGAGVRSRGYLEHHSVAWIFGGNSAPFGSTGMSGPPPAGDREPRHPLPTQPVASIALDS